MIKELNLAAETYSATALSFMGDCVFEMFVRTKIMELNQQRDLQKKAQRYVCAKAQNVMYHLLVEICTDEEKEILKRGRNTRVKVPKSASTSEYRHASGLEALFGYLYLRGEFDRCEFLFDTIYKGYNKHERLQKQ